VELQAAGKRLADARDEVAIKEAAVLEAMAVISQVRRKSRSSLGDTEQRQEGSLFPVACTSPAGWSRNEDTHTHQQTRTRINTHRYTRTHTHQHTQLLRHMRSTLLVSLRLLSVVRTYSQTDGMLDSLHCVLQCVEVCCSFLQCVALYWQEARARRHSSTRTTHYRNVMHHCRHEFLL